MAQVPIQKLCRKAILIKGFSKNEQELIDDKLHIEYYKSFFQSNAGGAYVENEIEILEDISTDNLKSYFEGKILDFIIVVLLGHGATQYDYQLFQLNETEIITPGQIEINSNKQLIIIESCRSIVIKIPIIDLSAKAPTYKEGGKLYIPICRQKARAIYNNQIKKCDNGQVICFACSQDETAKGYYFSKCIMQYAFNWHLSWKNYHTTLSIMKLMSDISVIVNEFAVKHMDEQQNPQLSGDINFPFAISKY